MMRALSLLAILCLAGCISRPVPQPRSVSRPASEPTQEEVIEAARVKAEARHLVESKRDIPNADLLKMLDLSQAMQHAVRRSQQHHTRANTQAAHRAIEDLRAFMAKEH
jgi:hypothetical protein